MNAEERKALDNLLDVVCEHGTNSEAVTLLAEKILDSKKAEIERWKKIADTLQKALQGTLLYGRPLPEMEAQEYWSWARHVEVAGGDLDE